MPEAATTLVQTSTEALKGRNMLPNTTIVKNAKAALYPGKSNLAGAASLIAISLYGFLAVTPAEAQLGPVPGLSALTLNQPNGPAQLDSAGTAGSLIVDGRTLGAQHGDRINILDAPYKAKCNGTLVSGSAGSYWSGNDDAPSIAAALAAAIAQRKALYIPGGTGYCLMQSSNPLATVNGATAIVGDGMDVSRLVWFLDDASGSLLSIAAVGTGYQVGDLTTVVGGAFSGSALQVKVLAVNAAGAVTQATAWGRASYTSMPPAGAATTGGSGTGLLVNIVAGGPGIGSPYQPTAASRPQGLTLRDFSIIGQGQQNPQQSNCGGMGIRIYDYYQLNILNVGVDYSRCMGIATRGTNIANIEGNRIRWSFRDSINVDSSWGQIVGNHIEHGGDDGIAATSYPPAVIGNGDLPTREGVVISGNFLTDTQGIVSIGAVGVTITGNTLIRPKLRALSVSVSTGQGSEGSNSVRGVNITGNTVLDLLTLPGSLGAVISSGVPYYIQVSSTQPSAGASSVATAGIPGLPVTTGEFVPLYPYTLNQATTGFATPIPPGIAINISNNIGLRTINASPNNAATPLLFSSLGFGQVYTALGWKDFPILHSSVGEATGLQFDVEVGNTSAILQNMRVSGNMLQGLGNAISVNGGVCLQDAEFLHNTFKDVTTYGMVFSTLPPSCADRIVFDGNLWDGDPYFTSAFRTVTGVASDGNSLFDGTWASGNPALFFGVPPGQTFRNNHIRNWSKLLWAGTTLTNWRLENNTTYANPLTGAGVGGALPTGEGWDVIVEDSNPSSATYGNVLNVMSHSSAAMPTMGTWITGQMVFSTAPGIAVPFTVGWLRLTTGSTNIADVDWMPLYQSGDLTGGTLLGRATGSNGGTQPISLGTGLSMAGNTLTASQPPVVTTGSIAASGIVTGLSVTGSGGSYDSFPSCSIAAPPSGTQAACQVNAMTMRGLTLTGGSGGSGFVVGQKLTLTGGTMIGSTQASFLVASIDSNGAILTFNGTAAGSGLSVLPIPVAVSTGTGAFFTFTPTSGTGTGAVLSVTFNVTPAGLGVTNAGSGYLTPPTVTLSTSPHSITAVATATTSSTLSVGSPGATGSSVAFQGAQADSSGVRTTLTGTAYTVPANTSLVRLVQTATIASQTVTLPSVTTDGTLIQFVNYSGPITALTFSPTIGGFTNGSTLAANTGLRIRWDVTAASWQREQ